MLQGTRIGELLVAAGIISDEQLATALAEQQSANARLGEILVRRGFVTEAVVTQILSHQLSVAWVSLEHVDFPKELLRLVPGELAQELTLIPVLFRLGDKKEKILYVAVDDPTNIPAMQKISEITGMHVRPLIAPASEIRKAIRSQYFPDEMP
jgi:type IV pilus assembly protein PilB